MTQRRRLHDNRPRRRLQRGKASVYACARCGAPLRKSKSSITVRFSKTRPAHVETLRATVCENGHLPYAAKFLDAIGVVQVAS